MTHVGGKGSGRVAGDGVGEAASSRRWSGTERFDRVLIHGSHPVWKRLAVSSLNLQNQVRHATAPVMQLFQQPQQSIVILSVPFWRNLAGDFIHGALLHLFLDTLHTQL